MNTPKTLEQFVFVEYFNSIVNNKNYSTDELNNMYENINTIIDTQFTEENTAILLILAILMNYDKNINIDEKKIDFTDKIILNFANKYNKDKSENYMKIIDKITHGIKICIMNKKTDLKQFMPPVLFNSNKKIITKSKLYIAVMISCIITMIYYTYTHNYFNFNIQYLITLFGLNNFNSTRFFERMIEGNEFPYTQLML